jgi:hypothetical protein
VGKGIPVITHMLVDPTLKYCDGGSAYQGTYGHYIVTNVRAGAAELGNTVVCWPAPSLTTARNAVRRFSLECTWDADLGPLLALCSVCWYEACIPGDTYGIFDELGRG